MVHVLTLVTFAFLAMMSIATPIEEGQHVGGFENKNNKITVFGHKRYPYMALIKITVMRNDGPYTSECGGVIIGLNTVVTAGHCLYQKLNPTGTVHAGIVHRVYEREAGQKLKIKDYRVHERYQRECGVGKRCCYEVNDIAIVWTENQFQIGPKVQIATLAKRPEKPLNKDGWIIGWGLNRKNEKPVTLQMGQVKMISNKECAKFYPKFYITENVICLRGVNSDVVASSGDSGGPIVIDGVVYGLCSQSMFSSEDCPNKQLSVYTFIPKYNKWIERIVSEGPPTQKGNKFKPSRKP